MRQPIQKNRSSSNALVFLFILGTILLTLPHSLSAQATSPWNTIHHNYQLDQFGPSGTTNGTVGWIYAPNVKFLTSFSVGFATPPTEGDLFIANGITENDTSYLRWVDPVSGGEIDKKLLGTSGFVQPLVTNFTDDGINMIYSGEAGKVRKWKTQTSPSNQLIEIARTPTTNCGSPFDPRKCLPSGMIPGAYVVSNSFTGSESERFLLFSGSVGLLPSNNYALLYAVKRVPTGSGCNQNPPDPTNCTLEIYDSFDVKGYLLDIMEELTIVTIANTSAVGPDGTESEDLIYVLTSQSYLLAIPFKNTGTWQDCSVYSKRRSSTLGPPCFRTPAWVEHYGDPNSGSSPTVNEDGDTVYVASGLGINPPGSVIVALDAVTGGSRRTTDRLDGKVSASVAVKTTGSGSSRITQVYSTVDNGSLWRFNDYPNATPSPHIDEAWHKKRLNGNECYAGYLGTNIRFNTANPVLSSNGYVYAPFRDVASGNQYAAGFSTSGSGLNPTNCQWTRNLGSVAEVLGALTIGNNNRVYFPSQDGAREFK